MIKEPSLETRKEVYNRWRGKCAFCGRDLVVDEHHIVAKSNNPSLIDDPDNLILLCSIHHALTLKKKPDGVPSLSFNDIQYLEKSKFAKADKRGFHFPFPQNFWTFLGNNFCCQCPYILIVNGKPLIEIWPQKPTYYTNKINYYLYMRFFDKENNFVGGMFANQWASVVNEEWTFDYNNTGDEYEMIEAKHKSKSINIKFERYSDYLYITGQFYFDGIRIISTHDGMMLPGNNLFSGNKVYCRDRKNVAFKINGNNKSAILSVGSRFF